MSENIHPNEEMKQPKTSEVVKKDKAILTPFLMAFYARAEGILKTYYFSMRSYEKSLKFEEVRF